MSVIDLTILPQEKDLGGFSVRRILPHRQRRMVGPFIFLDHMGPADFAVGQGIDVRPHPHIGLSTVTYLFEGQFTHRDSLGTLQPISPGAVNWMTAGRGIVHSERSSSDDRSRRQRLQGLQIWVALPRDAEEMAPSFQHHPAASLPQWDGAGVALKLVAGRALGEESPVTVHSPLFYLEARMQAGARLTLPPDAPERAAYLIRGSLRLGDDRLAPMTMALLHPGDSAVFTAESDCLVILLGGDPLSEPRFIDWNFVSSSRDRLEQAKQDWRDRRFPTIPGDDQEFIPLP